MIDFKYTTQGLSKIAAGKALVIDKIGFGNAKYEPNVNATALHSEKIKIAPVSAIVKDKTITLVVQLEGASEFSIREIGIYLNDGTLLCVVIANAGGG